MLTAWPVTARFRLPRAWTFSGHRRDARAAARTSGTSGPGTAPAPPHATGACSAAARSAFVDAPQPGHAALRADRRPGARSRLRQPRLPARRDGQIRRRYNGKRWIACRLAFRGWLRRPLLQPGRFTELFFLDDATALAAGHRPCALCRREDYVSFGEAWRTRPPRCPRRRRDRRAAARRARRAGNANAAAPQRAPRRAARRRVRPDRR